MREDLLDIQRRSLRRLRRNDPGFLRLQHAIKTLLAVLVVLGVFRTSALQLRLIGALAAGFLMQSPMAGSRVRRRMTMLLSGLAFAGVVTLGAGFNFSPWTEAAVLAPVAFLAFYARRFMPNGDLFPLMGFILCLIAAEMPTQNGWRSAAGEAQAVGAGLCVAFCINFFILPPKPRIAFAAGLDAFFVAASDFLGALRDQLANWTKQEPPDAEAHHPRREPFTPPRPLAWRRRPRASRRSIESVVKFNQGVFDSMLRIAESARLEPVLGQEYEALGALITLAQSIDQLVTARTDGSDEAREQMAHAVTMLAGEMENRRTSQADDEDDDDPIASASRWRVDKALGQLQAALLRADDPFRPDLAQMFTAMRSMRQLERARRALVEAHAELRKTPARDDPTPKPPTYTTRPEEQGDHHAI